MSQWDAEPIDVSAAEDVGAFFAACSTADTTVRKLPAPAFREWARLAAPSLAVIRDQRAVVGFVYSTRSTCRRDDRALQHFRSFVLPSHRRRGIATALLDWVERLPLEGPRPGLQCSVLFEWTAGNAFLDRHGFEVVTVDVGMERPSGPIEGPGLADGITLRAFDLDGDMQAWIDIHNAAYAQDRMFEHLDDAKARAHAAREGFAITVAEEDGRAIGFCMTLREKDDSPHIESIAVHPTGQRRGVGRALLRNAVAALVGDDTRAVTLDSHRGSHAYSLYVSEGFHETYRESVYRRDKRV